MKWSKTFAAMLLAAVLALALLTGCGGGTPDGKIDWDDSRTKLYYEVHGAAGDDIFLQMVMHTDADRVQGVYTFTRDSSRVYACEAFASGKNSFLADEQYVYEQYLSQTWYRRTMGTQEKALLRAGAFDFYLPTAQNVVSVKEETRKRFDKTYTAETVTVQVNGEQLGYIYYYDADGLDMIETLNTKTDIYFESIVLSGTPDKALLQVPTEWVG